MVSLIRRRPAASHGQVFLLEGQHTHTQFRSEFKSTDSKVPFRVCINRFQSSVQSLDPLNPEFRSEVRSFDSMMSCFFSCVITSSLNFPFLSFPFLYYFPIGHLLHYFRLSTVGRDLSGEPSSAQDFWYRLVVPEVEYVVR